LLEWLERNQFFVLGFAGALLFGALLLRDLGAGGQPPALVVREPAYFTDQPVLVHVAGEVVAPGLYELPPGARVADALDAAGGATAGANLESLNLARRLRDGEKVLIPARARSSPPAATLAPGERYDINTATREELMQINGIGEAYSRRIVDSRAVDGPFESVDDLRERGVLPAGVLDRIRDFITVSGR
jgi:competence protein ComEA